MRTPTFKQTLPWLFFVLPLVLSVAAASFTQTSVDTWYTTLNKSSLTPPNWVFAPVWTLLYLLMGASAFLVAGKEPSRAPTKSKKLALLVFLVQLGLNILWSSLFFGLHSPVWALVNILVLFVAIVATIVVFRPFSRIAPWFLAPYLLWVGFATYLNIAIVVLN